MNNLKAQLQPQEGPHLDVIVSWRGKVLNTFHFSDDRCYTIGNNKTCDVYLPVFEDRKFKHDWIQFRAGQACVTLGPDMKSGSVVGKSGSRAVSGDKVDLKQNEMLCAELANGEISLFVRYAPRANRPAAGPWLGVSLLEGMSLGFAGVVAVALSIAVSSQVAQEEDLTVDTSEKRVARIMYAPPSNGGSAPARRGAQKKIAEKAGQNAPTVKRDISKAGVLGVFGANGLRKKLDEAASGEGTLQGMAEKSQGGVGENQNLQGDYAGRAFENANASGNSLIGIGGVGTKGQGIAAGGAKGTDMVGRRSHTIKVGDEIEPVNGNIDKEAIRRVIAENIGQIRACYENALSRDPDLSGKLILEWQIDKDGKPGNARVKKTSLNSQQIANCVMSRIYTWRFPRPPPGVIGMVDYPFSFESSTQLNGG